jgi:hypothetical protein
VNIYYYILRFQTVFFCVHMIMCGTRCVCCVSSHGVLSFSTDIFVCKLPINKIKGYLYSILSLSGQSSGSLYGVCQIMVLIKTVSETKCPLFYIYIVFTWITFYWTLPHVRQTLGMTENASGDLSVMKEEDRVSSDLGFQRCVWLKRVNNSTMSSWK